MFGLIEESVLLKITHTCNSILEEIVAVDATIAKQLLKLDNKSIKIIIKHVPMSYRLVFSGGKIKLETCRALDSSIESDLTVKISSINLIKIKLTNAHIEQAIRDNDLEFYGNLNLAMDLQILLNKTELNLMDILQANLAVVTSDVFAWQFVKILNQVFAIIQSRSEDLSTQITDYLQLEAKILVSRTQVEEYCHDVDRLRDNVERLSARIKILESRTPNNLVTTS